MVESQDIKIWEFTSLLHITMCASVTEWKCDRLWKGIVPQISKHQCEVECYGAARFSSEPTSPCVPVAPSAGPGVSPLQTPHSHRPSVAPSSPRHLHSREIRLCPYYNRPSLQSVGRKLPNKLLSVKAVCRDAKDSMRQMSGNLEVPELFGENLINFLNGIFPPSLIIIIRYVCSVCVGGEGVCALPCRLDSTALNADSPYKCEGKHTIILRDLFLILLYISKYYSSIILLIFKNTCEEFSYILYFKNKNLSS